MAEADVLVTIALIEVIKSENGEKAEYVKDEGMWGKEFVQWCLSKSTDNVPKDIKDVEARPYNKDNILIGDILIFSISKDLYHYGIVYKIDSKYIYTIEGSSRRGSLGGVIYRGHDVTKRFYSVGYTRICGIIHPYDCITEDKVEEKYIEYPRLDFVDDVGRLLDMLCDDSVEDILTFTPVISLKSHNTNKLIIPVQKRLAALGYYKGQIDEKKPVFTEELSLALAKFQKDNVPDIPKRSYGILGAKSPTWYALLTV